MPPKKKTMPQNISTQDDSAKRKGQPAPAAKSDLTIDYPLDGEIITSPVYTVKLTALNPKSVEVSVNGAAWSSCRESMGNWWFDWSGYQAGACSIAARMTDKYGRVTRAKTHSFTVLI